ncbi:MAG TPA: helix-turn-helix domain-containing protein [Verrucomicrobiae bacterium]|nr:helix-turn-helix domain-containing protein [Verrucomicrobiae bacterium]
MSTEGLAFAQSQPAGISRPDSGKELPEDANLKAMRESLPRLYFSVKETAYMMGVGEKTVRRFLQRGLLKTSHALRTKLITRESILAFNKSTT